MKHRTTFAVSRSSNHLDISFSSTLENINKAVAETKKFLKDILFESEIFEICLVIREGMTNAVTHGNRYDNTKLILYSLLLKDGKLILEIEDQGNGFDWKKTSVPPLFAFSEAGHGRGLSIIQQCFGGYTYNDAGNKLILSKTLQKPRP